MASPFPQNATLDLKIPETTIIDEYGNETTTEAIAVEMTCYIRQANPSRDEVLGWDSQEEIPIKGKAIAPNQFPAGFTPFSIVNGTLDGQSVRVRVVPLQLSPWFNQATILGQGFTGAILNPIAWGQIA